MKNVFLTLIATASFAAVSVSNVNADLTFSRRSQAQTTYTTTQGDQIAKIKAVLALGYNQEDTITWLKTVKQVAQENIDKALALLAAKNEEAAAEAAAEAAPHSLAHFMQENPAQSAVKTAQTAVKTKTQKSSWRESLMLGLGSTAAIVASAYAYYVFAQANNQQ